MTASDLRDEAFDAALPLFVDRGFYGTSLGAVATRAGVTERELAAQFGDLAGLANQLYRHWKSELARAILGDGPVAAEPREQFRVFWYRGADFARTYPYATTFLRAARDAAWHDDATRALEVQVHQMFTLFIAHLRDDRVVRAESPEVLVALVLGASDGLFDAARRGLITLTDETAAAAERAVWAAIRR